MVSWLVFSVDDAEDSSVEGLVPEGRLDVVVGAGLSDDALI